MLLPMKRTTWTGFSTCAATALFCGVAFAATPWIKGVTDKGPLDYAVGEEMTFTLTVQHAQDLPPGLKLCWTRTGDDGQEQKGTADIASPLVVKTSLNRPGFVRLYAELRKADGKPWRTADAKGKKALVFFDGGAAADPRKLRPTKPVPADFEAFWAKRKAELAAVPMTANLEEIASPTPGAKLYKVSIACAGPRPSTGYLSIPEAPGKYPATVGFHGYNASWGANATNPPKKVPTNALHLIVSAHGFELGREPDYYRDFRKSVCRNGYGHAFDPEENAKPETCYFGGMAWRVMRGIEYVKSRPEWNGKDLTLTGGSQGSLQAMWGAALVPGVTAAKISIPWFCDVGGTEDGRNHGDWYPKWAPGLDYYDQVNIARLVPKTCRVDISRAGLGDYIAPPCGVAIMYGNLACPKSIVWVQGSTHGYVPPQPQRVTWK